MSTLFSLRSALVFSALALSITLLYPLSGDNALYMYMADLLVKGKLPYLGSWDVNYPGIVFLHLLHVLPFGGSEIAFHLFDIIAQLIGCYVVYRLTDDLSGSEHASWLASILFAVYYVSGGLSLVGERDCYIAILLASTILMLRLSRSTKALMGAGLMCGVMIMLRPTAGIFALALFIWLLIDQKQDKYRAIARFIVSGVIPVAIFALAYLIVGGFNDFIEATYTYNVEVYARLQLTFADLSVIRLFGVFLIGAIVGVGWLFRSSKRDAGMMLLMIVAAVIYLIPVYKFWYHFHPLMVLLFVVASIGWVEVIRRIAQYVSKPSLVLGFSTVLICGIFAITFVKGSRVHSALFEFIHEGGDVTESYRGFYSSPEWGQDVQDSIARYLTSKNARVVQSLTSPMYPLLKAGVVPANRFTNIYNLCWRSPKAGELLPMQIKWRNEYLRDLNRTPPDYIISSSGLPDHVFNNGYLPSDVLADFPQLQELLNDRYIHEVTIGGYILYRRRK